MVKTYKVSSFEDIVEIGTTFGMNWFRGHSKVFNNLTPKIYRKEYRSEMRKLFNPQFEFETVEKFKRYAPSILEDLPDSKDYLSWLFIMQHHDFPTRLLDWSESILVALFFCVIDSQNENGELWSILPWKLNEFSGFWGVPLPEHSLVKFLSNEPFHNSSSELVESYKLSELPTKPIAFLPNLVLPRITSQLSAFTIHPIPSEGLTIPDLIEDDQFLVRYIIPSGLKRKFEQKLNFLGVSHRSLFPDLEGLAKHFKREEKYYGWGQPKHPKFEKW